MTTTAEGLNVCGYLRTESGVGAAARRYLRALETLGIPLSLADVSDVSCNRADDREILRFDAEHPHPVNLVCGDVDLYFSIRSRLGDKFFEDRYNIGVWWWELPDFPKKWRDRFAYFDEIWAPTSFIANTLSLAAPVPVVRVPPVLVPRWSGSREAGRRRLDASADEQVFLFAFDFHSHTQRKNPLAVVEAFKQAFTTAEPARLVLKSVNGASDPGGLAQLRAAAEGQRIDVFDGYWSHEEVCDLIAACDVYVSLHRSEGAGLTISDAMALGKPVIATGWSGNMEFMTVSNSFPVRYELVEVEENVGPYRKGQIWAEPSTEHAAQLMRRIFQDREEAHRRGDAARRDIRAHYSEEAVAQLIATRLEAVRTRRQFDRFVAKTKQEYATYQQSHERLRQAVRESVPAGATVLVVSKGDEELVKLEQCHGWHFPQREDGVYSGFYPTDSTSAIKHLEALRAKGAEFLLLPAYAFWWLQYYADFARHLDFHYQRVRFDHTCLIYRLSPESGVESSALPQIDLEALSGQMRSLSAIEVGVREKLLDAEKRLAWRESQIEGAVAALETQWKGSGQYTPALAPAAPAPAPANAKQVAYRAMVGKVRQVVADTVPEGAMIIVISKGDAALVSFEGRTGWHFPQGENGVYAGFHPRDSSAAIQHLEDLRACGGQFLLIPASAYWWLDHYDDFRRHLEAHARSMRIGEHCIIYQLAPRRARTAATP